MYALNKTRRYSPLRRPTSSSCRGLRPLAKGFFGQFFGHLWCPVITLVTLNINRGNLKKNPKMPQKNPKKNHNPKKSKKVQKKNNFKKSKKIHKNPYCFPKGSKNQKNYKNSKKSQKTKKNAKNTEFIFKIQNSEKSIKKPKIRKISKMVNESEHLKKSPFFLKKNYFFFF